MTGRVLMLIFLFISAAEAGVSLTIEHPRYPSHQEDIYKIKCNGKCELEILKRKPSKGAAKVTSVYSSKISELIKLKDKGGLPQSKTNAKPVLYKIEAQEGKKSVNLVLGYPLSYEGEEYKRYVAVVSIIEELKREMSLELTEKKK